MEATGREASGRETSLAAVQRKRAGLLEQADDYTVATAKIRLVTAVEQWLVGVGIGEIDQTFLPAAFRLSSLSSYALTVVPLATDR